MLKKIKDALTIPPFFIPLALFNVFEICCFFIPQTHHLLRAMLIMAGVIAIHWYYRDFLDL